MKTSTMVMLGVGVLAVVGVAYYFLKDYDSEEGGTPADIDERQARLSEEAAAQAARNAQARAEWEQTAAGYYMAGVLSGI